MKLLLIFQFREQNMTISIRFRNSFFCFILNIVIKKKKIITYNFIYKNKMIL